jgi:hypothetical protein
MFNWFNVLLGRREILRLRWLVVCGIQNKREVDMTSSWLQSLSLLHYNPTTLRYLLKSPGPIAMFCYQGQGIVLTLLTKDQEHNL